jgi:hypothetical protein
MASAKINRVNHYGDSALHKAAEYNRWPIIERLLQAGAEPNLSNHNGDTPLHKAAWMGHGKVLQKLILAKVRLTLANQLGNTALHLAALHGHRHVIQLLLEAKVALDMPNQQGNTAVHLAVSADQVAILQLLLKAGAHFNLKNQLAQTPLQLAKVGSHEAQVLMQAHNTLVLLSAVTVLPQSTHAKYWNLGPITAQNRMQVAGGILMHPKLPNEVLFNIFRYLPAMKAPHGIHQFPQYLALAQSRAAKAPVNSAHKKPKRK